MHLLTEETRHIKVRTFPRNQHTHTHTPNTAETFFAIHNSKNSANNDLLAITFGIPQAGLQEKQEDMNVPPTHKMLVGDLQYLYKTMKKKKKTEKRG